MAELNKIATCCYCGSRTLLQLQGQVRHELACGSCGAPLHHMKMVKIQPERPPKEREIKVAAYKPKSGHKKHTPKKETRGFQAFAKMPSRPSRKKRRGWNAKRMFDRLEDLIEDIFD